MKKLFIAALLTVTLATSAFAADINIGNAASTNFKLQFRGASDVTWNTSEDYVRVCFNLKGDKMEAFYDAKGELFATTKAITTDDLPLVAKRALAKKFSGYTINETIKYESADEGAYFVSAQNEKENLILKIGEEGFVSVFKKSSK